jgi:hypothetical protein
MRITTLLSLIGGLQNWMFSSKKLKKRNNERKLTLNKNYTQNSKELINETIGMPSRKQ